MPAWTDAQLPHVADVLMAAAGSDDETVSTETSAVRRILKELAGRVSPELDARVRGFDARRFDLGATAKALGALDEPRRRALLQLVSRVTESDGVHDLAESDFIVRVARALGAGPDEYAGLTIELLSAPPPPPTPPR